MQYEDHLRPSQFQAASHLHCGVSGASISCALKCTSFEGALCKISQGLLANAYLLPVNISAYVDDCCENALGFLTRGTKVLLHVPRSVLAAHILLKQTKTENKWLFTAQRCTQRASPQRPGGVVGGGGEAAYCANMMTEFYTLLLTASSTGSVSQNSCLAVSQQRIHPEMMLH